MTPAALADLVRSVAHDVLASRGVDATALSATVTVERPRDPEHGDYATNVALQAGSKAGVPPRELAHWLAQELAQRRGVHSAEVAGPGFLNLRLAPDAKGETVKQVLATGKRFGALQGLPTPRLAALEELPTVQYAHARLAALARHAADLRISCEDVQLELLDHPHEVDLIGMLGEFPRIVAAAVDLHESRALVHYLEQLTAAYHRFDTSCRVLPMGDEQDEPSDPRHVARLALCRATRQV
ncbi:MAG: DALR anticodon-binding domain-containing protein, partial [Pseudonocardiaceae bacterium]